MKKLLMVAVAASALTATPAMAQDNTIAITTTASVAPTCKLAAFVRQEAGNNSTGVGIGFDPTGASELINTANSAVNLGLNTPQLLASLSGFGNVGCTISVNTDNNFKLQTGSGGANREVPFNLTLTGQGANATASTNGSLSLNLGTQPGQPQGQTRSLSLTFPTAANPLNLAAGAYADTIRVTIAPTV